MRLKRDVIYVAVIILLLGIVGQVLYTYKYVPYQQRKIDVYYNHDRELNKEIIGLIRGADKYVYFAVYTFTRDDIRDALLAAKYRGLTVVGITDRDQYNQLDSQKKLINELRKAGIPVYEQDHSGIMHLKVLVTERGYASGSYNWTQAATNINDEVLEVGHDEDIRKNYERVLLEIFNRYKDVTVPVPAM